MAAKKENNTNQKSKKTITGNTCGGYRPGAGRPKKSTKLITIRIPKELHDGPGDPLRAYKILSNLKTDAVLIMEALMRDDKAPPALRANASTWIYEAGEKIKDNNISGGMKYSDITKLTDEELDTAREELLEKWRKGAK